MLIKIGATLASPSILFTFVVICCLLSDINIFVLQLILKFDMFFMTVKCIRKSFQSLANFLCYGFFCPWKWLLWLFACDIKNMLTAIWWYSCTKIFYPWNSIILQLEGHICKVIHFDDTYCAKMLIASKTVN